ncbi:FAD dependent oxidoreductase [Altererythrobacter salegens]|uniref:FAD dependent oxidoreductase n=1 Tax=Croceibacterium salegens TaxID=1737568 RepID=A0A6I4ST84_9SPHN|nr:FAD/NAD(P)-binding protein [Croceibacterium salegens]MXO59095.1 FAD dependent oxidoreductase [Croceibacterium salegens]
MAAPRIIIVGGGFSGATAAVQLARTIAGPLEIVVIEPAASIGPGLPYDTADPSYRLNAISLAHSIDVADPWHFTRWFDAQGLRKSDPGAGVASGEVFARRSDYGRYLSDTVAAHAAMPNGTRIGHVRGRAVDCVMDGTGATVVLDDGSKLAGEQVILATGNPRFRHPAAMTGAVAGHPGIHLDPLHAGTSDVAPDARLLVVGAGLTALDIIASLLGRGHRGTITAISRHGLRPQPQPARIVSPLTDLPPPPVIPLDLLESDLPDYLAAEDLSALSILRGVRKHAAETTAEGLGWQAAFDAMAFPLSRIWPRLPLAEKQRALRHLRAQYDAHRFRTPPMTDALVRAHEARGQVEFRKSRLAGLEPTAEGALLATLQAPGGSRETVTFDAVLNCTGFDRASQFDNPLLFALRRKGMLTPHSTGFGIVTDADNRLVSEQGRAAPSLRAIGPLTAGMFGDPLGAFFISAQVHRLIPGLASDLGMELAPVG